MGYIMRTYEHRKWVVLSKGVAWALKKGVFVGNLVTAPVVDACGTTLKFGSTQESQDTACLEFSVQRTLG